MIQIIMLTLITFGGNEKCCKRTEKYYRNSMSTHFIAIHKPSAPAIHPSNKPGTTYVASYSDALENKPTSKSLTIKKRKRKVRRGLRKRRGNISEKSSRTCNFYCANVNSFKSKADSIDQIILEHNIDVCYCVKLKYIVIRQFALEAFSHFLL